MQMGTSLWNALVRLLPEKWSKGEVHEPDFSRLLQSDCPLAYDFELTHQATKTTWRLHYFILMNHPGIETTEKVDRMAKVLKSTRLPISDFLRYLYFTIDVALGHAQLYQCIQLCELTGIDPSHLLWLLEAKLAKLSNEALVHFTIEVYLAHTTSTSAQSDSESLQSTYVLSLLASRCRTYVTAPEIEQALFSFNFRKTSLDVPQLVKLSSIITSFLSPHSPTTLILPTLKSSSPKMAAHEVIQHGLDSAVLAEVQAGTKSWKDKYIFAFIAHGDTNRGIFVNSLLLYPQWKWFEKLVKSNCLEARTRTVEMPEHLTYQAIQSILMTLYQSASCKRIQDNAFADNDLAVVYRFRDELMLSTSSVFADLLQKCLDTLSSPPTSTNDRIKRLGWLWNAGFDLSSPLLTSMLKSVHDDRSMPVSALAVLPLPLRLAVCACETEKCSNPETILSAAELLETFLAKAKK